MSIALQEWQQEWLAEGMAKGRVQGIEEGVEQGIIRGRAETLLRQMRRRFGPLSDDVVQRVRAATPDDLDRWTDAILDAADLDKLFGASKHPHIFDISPGGIGTIGAIVNFVGTIVVSKMTRPPADHIVEMVEQIRYPAERSTSGAAR